MGSSLGNLVGAVGGKALVDKFMEGSTRQNKALAVILSSLLGTGAGGYGGYRLGKELFWFDDEKRKTSKPKKKQTKREDESE